MCFVPSVFLCVVVQCMSEVVGWFVVKQSRREIA